VDEENLEPDAVFWVAARVQQAVVSWAGVADGAVRIVDSSESELEFDLE
jgi:hypothetical protein